MDSSAELVLATIRAVEERDLDRLFELYHDDVEFVHAPSLPYGGTVRGKEANRRQILARPAESWSGTWTPLQPTAAERRMDPRVIAGNGVEVAVVYRQRAVSASGERLDAPVLGLYEVRDGKFARAQMFHFDTAAVVGFLERARPPAAGRG
jgi:ketosteroid isomerase-like protein